MNREEFENKIKDGMDDIVEGISSFTSFLSWCHYDGYL